MTLNDLLRTYSYGVKEITIRNVKGTYSLKLSSFYLEREKDKLEAKEFNLFNDNVEVVEWHICDFTKGKDTLIPTLQIIVSDNIDEVYE